MLMDFEKEYSKNIEKLYGEKRNNQVDIGLINLNNLSLPHKYQIDYRVDMTNIDVYSIDPDGCEDADDAFSIYTENNKFFLAIHIADPTEYINIRSDLWHDIEKRIITRYPSNRKPIHMMPNEIMEKSSLMENDYGNIKKSLSIVTEIDKETYLPKNKIKLLFTKIKVKKENALSYNTNVINETIKDAIKISLALQHQRGKKTIGIKLKLVDTTVIKYDAQGLYLYRDKLDEKQMKQMIEEFAIFANSYIGEYLNIHLDDHGIYRTCDASAITGCEFNNIDGNELLQYIITNGISAEYMNNVASHDLVGSKEYTHFTSPIRRASDCICHYLLKYLYLKNINNDIEIPFEKIKLKELSEKCLIQTKKIKKIQYTDTKFRLIQAMYEIIKLKKQIEIQYYCSGYKNGFINIIINKIDGFPVYLSYSLKRNNYKHDIGISQILKMNIRTVNIRQKYDEGSIPELDNLFL
jgi:exoribonuclease R